MSASQENPLSHSDGYADRAREPEAAYEPEPTRSRSDHDQPA